MNIVVAIGLATTVAMLAGSFGLGSPTKPTLARIGIAGAYFSIPVFLLGGIGVLLGTWALLHGNRAEPPPQWFLVGLALGGLLAACSFSAARAATAALNDAADTGQDDRDSRRGRRDSERDDREDRSSRRRSHND